MCVKIILLIVFTLLSIEIFSFEKHPFKHTSNPKIKNNLQENDSTIRVGILFPFTKKNVYTNLFFKGDYIDLISTQKINSNKNIIHQTEDELRVRLHEKFAQEYFHIDGLNKILIIDDLQEIIDTLTLINFEYYENLVESSYIATYIDEESINDKIFISLNYSTINKMRKSPQPVSVPSFKNSLQDMLNLNTEYVVWDECFVTNKDTFSIFSYYEQATRKPSVYLCKNGGLTDIIKEGYIFEELKPVPLANDREIFYMASVSIPDTDNFWAMLIGIELDSGKFIFYKHNTYINK